MPAPKNATIPVARTYQAAGLIGAIATIVLGVLSRVHVDLTQTEAAALVVVLSYAAGKLKVKLDG